MDKRPLLKICGITRQREVDAVCGFPVDLYGLWWRTGGGARELTTRQVIKLARKASGTARPCLVTLESEPALLAEILERSGVRHLQMHGFALPGAMAGLRRELSRRGLSVRIFKVLHVGSAGCVEERLLDAYIRSGVDMFIIDNFEDRASIGSTGRAVDMREVLRLRRLLRPVPLMVAGGVDEGRMIEYAGTGIAGFDVDTAAREKDAVSPGRIRSLWRAFRQFEREEMHETIE